MHVQFYIGSASAQIDPAAGWDFVHDCILLHLTYYRIRQRKGAIDDDKRSAVTIRLSRGVFYQLQFYGLRRRSALTMFLKIEFGALRRKASSAQILGRLWYSSAVSLSAVPVAFVADQACFARVPKA